MKMNLMKAVRTGFIAISLGAISLTSVYAAPMPSVHVPSQNGGVVQVRENYHRPPPYASRDRHDRYSYRGREPDRRGYYHGYRGYHDRRPGYRRSNDGLWYPAAAFALGAIIGGTINR